MNKEAKNVLRKLLKGKREGLVLDIGSYDINGSFRNVMEERGWIYCGVDRVDGPNVDKLMIDDYTIPWMDDVVDLVISASCLQYTRNPFKLVKDMHRILQPGGIVVLFVPREETEGLIGLPKELCPNNDTTFDCWRILKDGMEALLVESGFEVVDIFYHDKMTIGVGRK